MSFQRLLHPVGLSLQSLKAHQLRSALTVLGIVLGVASVIVMLAIGARQPCDDYAEQPASVHRFERHDPSFHGRRTTSVRRRGLQST